MHSHSHSHSHRPAHNSGRLKIALALTAVYMLAEAAGGYLTGSLALLADAGHMFTDVAALALTLFAFWFAARPANPRKTYGYYRLEILAAFINGITLVLISLWIFYEAYERFFAPPPVKSLELMLIATGGLTVNLFCAWLLYGEHHDNLNMRGAWLHIVGDALGSVTAIVAGALIYAFGWYWADPLCSVLIALIIIWGAWSLIKESVDILLEGTPAHINVASVEETILNTEGVVAVHDLHVWTISSGRDALSAHIVYDENFRQTALLKDVRRKLHDSFGIDHLTLQMEAPNFHEETPHGCQDCFETRVYAHKH
jgi:cobalt-zinc-cadmium efflux system protein